ncbi:MAG TPA: pyrroline-5-carboxylate reductase [Candidatus Fournierella merdipullorum]|uniref:Pyrroline-5-carboxylate reductase n=1 Tax=Candidatus Allofournierella merdipullorum TaxID=2838595 RepID=A0A9D2E6C0_9FIRM|nr:pyrroline-5-carboxylate reductase [Candidatus Fournierella merdipullorum]
MGYTFGFIGAGNMGGALARAACRWRPEQVVLTDRTLDKAVALAEELDCDIAMDNDAVAREAKFIFLGVKPQMMADMLAALAPTLEERGGGYVLVSMAAGLTIARLEEMLGFEAPILRIMPNTPAAIGEGMILYAANDRVAAADVEEFCDKMVGAGRFDALDERLIDAASSVSGCGPAFVYQFIEALADGGVACGLPRPKAMEYAAQTLVGAAGMVLATGRHPGQLKDEVCSPGGSTIAGVYALEKGGLRAAVMSAVLESFEKNRELGKQ